MGDWNLTAKNRKFQMPGGLARGGGERMLRLQIDRYIIRLPGLGGGGEVGFFSLHNTSFDLFSKLVNYLPSAS